MKSVLLVFITDESEDTYTNVEIVHINQLSPIILPFGFLIKTYVIIFSHNNIINNDHFIF